MKRVLVLVLAMIVVLCMAVPVFAGNEKVTNNYQEGAELKLDFNNAQFHCNAINGNGRVWPEKPADMKKFDGQLTFTKAEGTLWNLTGIKAAILDGKGKPTGQYGASLEMVECPQCGSTKWITFSNNSGVPDGKNIQMQHPGNNFTIVKNWEKNNEPYPDGTKFTAGFEVTLSSGKTFKVGPGKYHLPNDLTATVEEISCTNGFDLVKVELNGVGTDITAPVSGMVGGDIAAFTNADTPPPNDPYAALSFEKKVEGLNIVAWLIDKGYDFDEIEGILAGLEFYLDGDNGNYGPVTPDYDGKIVFEKVTPGTYVLSEKITGAAIGIFKKMDDIEITLGEGDNQYFVLGGAVTGNIEGADVVDGDKFKIINGHGRDYQNRGGGGFGWGYDDSGIGYQGLNATGHIFYIGVINNRTGEEFYSFCANAGSTNFEEQGNYMVGYSIKEIEWIQAFNYINDKFGDLNDNRVLTQVITWALLGAVDVYNLDQTKLNVAEKAAIIEIWENYEGYVGSGLVVDVLFLTCEDPNHGFTNCQPQIVPVFGTFFVQNEPDDPWNPLGDVSFLKVKYGGLIPIDKIEEFGFELFMQDTDGNYTIPVPNLNLDGSLYNGTGYYYTELDGTVSVKELKPGSYVFREAFTVDHSVIPNGTHGYRYVWKPIYPGGADGLYFNITDKGKTVWRDLDEGIDASVDNIYYCKHSVQWSYATNQEEFDWSVSLDNRQAFPVDNHPYGQWGFLIYGGCGDAACDITYTEATCTTDKVIHLWHNCDVSATGFNIAVPGTKLGHDLIIRNPDGFTYFYGYFANICTRAHTHVGWFDLGYGYDEDAWLAFFESNFGSYDLKEWEATGETFEFNGLMFNQMVDPSSPDYAPLYVYVR